MTQIVATGQWAKEFCGSEMKWNINCSDILTQLIKDAGRFCDRYASDLFIIWQDVIADKLYQDNWESHTITFAFYDSGVEYELSNELDRQPVTEQLNNNRFYYRKIDRLKITVNGNIMTIVMEV